MRIYSQDMVARRLIPLVVALALAFAPAASEACQASCLSHPVATMAVGSEHHHGSPDGAATEMPVGHVHHQATQAQGPESTVRTAGQPPCDHGATLPAFSAAPNNTPVAPGLVVSAFVFPDISGRSLRVLDAADRVSSGLTVLPTQLRV